MSKFNQTRTFTPMSKQHDTVNKDGIPAYSMTLLDELVSQVLTTFFGENKFYGDTSNKLVANIRKVLDVHPKFVANLAIYARKELHLRSVAHVIVGEMANHKNGKPFTRQTIGQVVERPDDMAEILSYHIANFGSRNNPASPYGKKTPKGRNKRKYTRLRIPNSMKKGIADAFVRFDEFSLQKYNNDSKEIKLKDILFLVCPKAKNAEQFAMWKRLIEGNLATPLTWETELSKNGNTRESWEKLIDSNSVGYMAMLRNLRNIIKANVRNMDKVYEKLGNEKAVLNSKQLPFRFYSAYRTLRDEGIGTNKIYDVLEDAISISAKNLPQLGGVSFVVGDNSGSMGGAISAKSTITCRNISSLLLSISHQMCEDSITGVFADYYKSVPVSKRSGVLHNMTTFDKTDVGYSTNMQDAIKHLLDSGRFVDRIIILTDNVANSALSNCQRMLEEYKRRINKKVWVHAIDLQGYGTQQFKGDRVNYIAGWSEKVLDFIYLAEQGISTLTDKVDNYFFL